MSTHNLTNHAQIRNFTQIELNIDPEYGICWVYQKPSPRPCFNPALVEELRSLQLMLEVSDGLLPYKGGNVQINYLVLDSKISGIFNLGGDLNLFRHCIINGDRKGLYAYALTLSMVLSWAADCQSRQLHWSGVTPWVVGSSAH